MKRSKTKPIGEGYLFHLEEKSKDEVLQHPLHFVIMQQVDSMLSELLQSADERQEVHTAEEHLVYLTSVIANMVSRLVAVISINDAFDPPPPHTQLLDSIIEGIRAISDQNLKDISEAKARFKQARMN